MKTIYSLQEFRQEVLKLASSIDENFTSIKVEVNHNGQILFRAYIPKTSWVDGATMEDCLLKIRNKLSPPPIQNTDVEIEILESVIEEPKTQPYLQPKDLPF